MRLEGFVKVDTFPKNNLLICAVYTAHISVM